MGINVQYQAIANGITAYTQKGVRINVIRGKIAREYGFLR
jgi:hypothetical protein